MANLGHRTAAPPLPVRCGLSNRQCASPTLVTRDPPPSLGRGRYCGQPRENSAEQRVDCASPRRARRLATIAPSRRGDARARRNSHCRCRSETIDHSIRRLRQTAKRPKGIGGGRTTSVESRSTKMTSEPDFDSELDALLEAGKVIPPLPDVVRARSLARARATMTMAALSRIEPTLTPRRRGLTFALAVVAVVAVASASALAALQVWSTLVRRSEPAPLPTVHAVAPPRIDTVAAPAPTLPPIPTPQITRPQKPQRAAHSVRAQESYAAELALLQRAQVAYAGGDFVNALALVAEHGRRFPRGRLAEEREALRVRALLRAGRTEEARRAEAGFAERFPRSVLLPRSNRDPQP